MTVDARMPRLFVVVRFGEVIEHRLSCPNVQNASFGFVNFLTAGRILPVSTGKVELRDDPIVVKRRVNSTVVDIPQLRLPKFRMDPYHPEIGTIEW